MEISVVDSRLERCCGLAQQAAEPHTAIRSLSPGVRESENGGENEKGNSVRTEEDKSIH